MKKYAAVFHILLFTILMISCKPKKNLLYMSNNNFEQEVSQAKYSGLHIQEGDRLQILVSAFDEIAVRRIARDPLDQFDFQIAQPPESVFEIVIRARPTAIRGATSRVLRA